MATLKASSFSGVITTWSPGDRTHTGIKLGDVYLCAINKHTIFQNNEEIRFGTDAWDYDQWAGLKYSHSSKIVYLGIAASPFTYNSPQSGGKIYTPGIDDIYIGNGSYKVIHENNLSDYYQNKTNVGHTPYEGGDANTKLLTVNDLAYWDGSHSSAHNSNLAYCDRGRFGTIVTASSGDYAAASHTHSYLPLSGGTMSNAIKYAGGSYSWFNNQHYASDGSKFSQYNENAAYITQTTYTGWQAIWQGPNADDAQWSFGNYANNFYLNRFAKGRAENSPNQQWCFKSDGSFYSPGTIYVGSDAVALAKNIPSIPGSLPANGGNADTVGGWCPGNVTNSLMYAIRGTDVNSNRTDYWAAMVNSTSPTGGWYHIISMDWTGADKKNWISQIAIPTQDGGVPYYRRNNYGGLEIGSSTWHKFYTDENITYSSGTGTLTIN